MRLIIHRYIFREMWPIFLSTIFVFTLIMLATRTMSITEWIVDRGVHPFHALKLVFYMLPNVILFSLPAASLLAVLIAFLRMASDNEIVALNSSGISLFQLLPSVLAVSIIGCLMTSLIALFAVPWGNRSFKDTIFQIVESKVDVNVKERIFNELFKDVVFYVNSISPRERIMRDVFVVDRRDQSSTNSIVAREAQVLLQPDNGLITVRFKEGTVFVIDKDLKSGRNMKFRTYDLNLNMKDMMSSLSSRKRSPKEMYVSELIHEIRNTPKGNVRHNELIIKLLESFAIPLAVFLMGLIGAPLGAQIKVRARSLGIVTGLVVFLVYYMCLMGARSLCETGKLHPYLGTWIPDLFLVAFVWVLFRRAQAGGYARFPRNISEQWNRWGRVGGRLFRRVTGQAPAPCKNIANPSMPTSDGDRAREPIAVSPRGQGDTSLIEEPYVASVRGGRFHRCGSSCGERISPRNRVFFKSRKDALAQKFSPCKGCKP